jgi:hypothetical protein
MSKKYQNSRILVLSDMHQPFAHPDAVSFLKAIRTKYKPDRVICIGDEVDAHNLSFHDSDPDLMSAGDELKEAISTLMPIYKLFPKVDVIDSNHGSLAFRKAYANGIPKAYLRSYGEVLSAPTGWKWHTDLTITMSDGNQVYFHHGLSSNILKVVKEYSINVCQGHFHNSAGVQYASTPEKLLWGLQVGCLINDKSMAFAYNKTTLGRPLIGVGLIIDGQPRWLPMILGRHGRWNGKVS